MIAAKADARAERSLELEIEALAVGGDGVARDENGRVVFVPRSAPGDHVRVEVTQARSSFARARIREVLRPGGGRRNAPCPYYAACGGCQVQHLTGPAQLEAKRTAVADALERIGGLSVEVPPLITAGPDLGYRNRITLTLRRVDEDGGEDGGEDGVTAGYHRHDAPGELVDVAACPLAEGPIDAAWLCLREGWGRGAEILPAGPELRVTVRASARGGIALLVEGGDAAREGDPRRVASLIDALECYAWRPDEEGPLRVLAGRPALRESWLGIPLDLPPRAFLQANRYAARAMEAHLDELLGDVEGRRLVDLYCGVGARPIRWARRGARAAALESDGDAVEAGISAAKTLGATVAFRTGSVEERAKELLPADAAIVNPPRVGLSREVCDLLCEAELEELAYVSCDPATLARDLDRLAGSFRIASLQPFDAFPQTAHIETIAWLVPR